VSNFDVVIVGSGAGGGMAALRLCERGFKVAMIERGPEFDPRKDYIQNYPDWDLREDPLSEALRSEQTIDLNYRTPLRDSRRRRAPFRYHRVHGVGGSTLHYQGEAHRFAEHAFDMKTRYGWGLDWPISYHELAPYYQQAENLLGVAGEAGNRYKPRRGPFPTPAHPLSQRSLLLKESARKLGFELLANSLALPSTSVDGRTPCQHSGGCNFGCVFGAKSSIDQAILPRAIKTGNLTVVTDTRATELVLDVQGEVDGVRIVNQDGNSTLRGRNYVLACGAIETPRLMLVSRGPLNEKGYANSFDQVGRYFMETVFARAVPRTRLAINMYGGPPLDSRVWDFCLPKDSHTCGFVLGSAGFLYPEAGPNRQALKIDGIGREHKQKMRENFGRGLYLFGVAEQEPQSGNTVSLSTARDDAGIPKVKVHCEYSSRDKRTLNQISKILDSWIRATPGLAHGQNFSSLNRSAATHVAGTCRMGNCQGDSVVDAFGRVHGQSNCYIADGSVLPTQGSGDSPSLTIQALALRTADKICDELT